jgi:hypothetical protein
MHFAGAQRMHRFFAYAALRLRMTDLVDTRSKLALLFADLLSGRRRSSRQLIGRHELRLDVGRNSLKFV